jgi:hypothetical protein
MNFTLLRVANYAIGTLRGRARIIAGREVHNTVGRYVCPPKPAAIGGHQNLMFVVVVEGVYDAISNVLIYGPVKLKNVCESRLFQPYYKRIERAWEL